MEQTDEKPGVRQKQPPTDGKGVPTGEQSASSQVTGTSQCSNRGSNIHVLGFETSEIMKAFRLIDKDGDGTISTEELGIVMRSIGMDPTESELTNLAKTLDQDGNGKIELQEFIEIMEKEKPVVREKELPTDGEGVPTGEHASSSLVKGTSSCSNIGSNINVFGFDTSEILQAFQLFDTNGDGTITTEELGNVMRSIGMDPTESELKNLANTLDQDGNGKIELQDFIEIMEKTKKSSEYDVQLREAFRVFDKDSTGSIGASDFRHLMTTLGERFPDEEVDEIIEEVGLTKDGRISCEEFVRVMTFQ